MQFRTLLLITALGTSFSASAEATFVSEPQNKSGTNYTGFNITESYSISSKGEIETDKDYKNRGFDNQHIGGNVYVGTNLTEYFRTELDLGYRAFKYKNVATASGITDTDSQKLKIYTLMLNQKIDTITIGNRLTPYITAGLGMSRLQPGNLHNTLDVSGSVINTTFKMKDTTNFIWQGGIGASFKVTDRIMANVELKRVNYGSMKHADNKKVTLKANEFSGGLRINF